jgi:aspartate aminotransferase-like enzyme
LSAAVDIIQHEGLDARFARHACLGPMFRAGMAALGFSPFTAPSCLAPTLSVLRYPEGVTDTDFREELAQRGVIAAGCLGDFKGRGVRFGHMGNITSTEILQALSAIEGALVDVGHMVQPGDALVAAQRTFHGQLQPA